MTISFCQQNNIIKRISLMHKNVFIFVLSLFLSVNARASNAGIVASVKPLHSLVSAVVGDTDKVSLLISGNVSPHNFALKPSHAKMLNNTAVFLSLIHI